MIHLPSFRLKPQYWSSPAVAASEFHDRVSYLQTTITPAALYVTVPASLLLLSLSKLIVPQHVHRDTRHSSLRVCLFRLTSLPKRPFPPWRLSTHHHRTCCYGYPDRTYASVTPSSVTFSPPWRTPPLQSPPPQPRRPPTGVSRWISDRYGLQDGRARLPASGRWRREGMASGFLLRLLLGSANFTGSPTSPIPRHKLQLRTSRCTGTTLYQKSTGRPVMALPGIPVAYGDRVTNGIVIDTCSLTDALQAGLRRSSISVNESVGAELVRNCTGWQGRVRVSTHSEQ